MVYTVLMQSISLAQRQILCNEVQQMVFQKFLVLFFDFILCSVGIDAGS